jgi:hypothetical protein
MREVVRGQFFGEAGDEDDDDDYNDYDNYNEETDEENLDAGVSDPEKGS